MAKLIKKKTPVEQVIEEAEEDDQEEISLQNRGNFEHCVSTGSTLLDLIISGGRHKGGGIPGGIILEIFGPTSLGKTAILSEIVASAQSRGDNTRFLDPEARLDHEYSRIYGVDLDKADYHRPDTVKQVFDIIYGWNPEPAPIGACNVIATDGLAALSSELEMSEKGDKMAGRRIAKDFNEGLRKTCRIIRNNDWLIANTNQVRTSDYGETTPGGKGIPFFSSLRIKVAKARENLITKKVKFYGKDQEQTIGIRTVCEVVKSSVDVPYRKCDIYILFNYGIDDIRGNLQYVKTVTGASTYDGITKQYQAIRQAIRHIEKEGLQKELKEKTIKLWEELDEKFKEQRQPKQRI